MNFETDIQNCIKALEAGEVILYPTDTIWGLGCDATNSLAVEKIFKLKKRDESKSLIILLPDAMDILKYVANPPLNFDDVINEQKVPTTIIYDNALHIATNAIADDGSMAIRICKEPFVYALLKRFRKPIISTSANISGTATASNFKEITAEIILGANYVVAYKQNDETPAVPSRILKWKNNEELIVIRN